MNKLKSRRVCLSGAIDRVADDGVIWRNYIKEESKKRNLGLLFFDPCDKPAGLGSETKVEKYKLKRLINEGKWAEAKVFVKQFRRYDLRGIDWCDLVIVKIDVSCHLCGTYDEIFTAYRQGKPVFIIMGKDQKKEDIPGWLVSYIKDENDIFETEDECIKHLELLNEGKMPFDNRWVKI